MSDDPEQHSDVAARPAADRARALDKARRRNLALFDAAASALVDHAAEPARADEPITGRTLLRPRWIVFHIGAWAFAALAVRLGWWQLHVSESKGFDLQNFGYWLQWWLIALFSICFWARAIVLARRPPADRRTSGLVAAAPGSGIVRAATPAAREQATGAVDLVAPSSTPDNPVVYRGYKLPASDARPVRSHGDSYHDWYNDYLWQIAMADGETPDERDAPE